MTGEDVEMNNKLGGSTSKPEKEEEEVITVVISQPEEAALPKDGPELKDGEKVSSNSPKKELSLQRSDSCDHEFCRVCQQQTRETLMELGCRCRGDLAKTHRSCIDNWFQARGSNKCEICQQVASNIPSPNALPNSNYWMWRVDPAALGASSARQQRVGLSLIAIYHTTYAILLQWTGMLQSTLGGFLYSHWWSSFRCDGISLSWSFCHASEHHNRCSLCAGIGDGVPALT